MKRNLPSSAADTEWKSEKCSCSSVEGEFPSHRFKKAAIADSLKSENAQECAHSLLSSGIKSEATSCTSAITTIISKAMPLSQASESDVSRMLEDLEPADGSNELKYQNMPPTSSGDEGDDGKNHSNPRNSVVLGNLENFKFIH